MYSSWFSDPRYKESEMVNCSDETVRLAYSNAMDALDAAKAEKQHWLQLAEDVNGITYDEWWTLGPFLISITLLTLYGIWKIVAFLCCSRRKRIIAHAMREGDRAAGHAFRMDKRAANRRRRFTQAVALFYFLAFFALPCYVAYDISYELTAEETAELDWVPWLLQKSGLRGLFTKATAAAFLYFLGVVFIGLGNTLFAQKHYTNKDLLHLKHLATKEALAAGAKLAGRDDAEACAAVLHYDSRARQQEASNAQGLQPHRSRGWLGILGKRRTELPAVLDRDVPLELKEVARILGSSNQGDAAVEEECDEEDEEEKPRPTRGKKRFKKRRGEKEE